MSNGGNITIEGTSEQRPGYTEISEYILSILETTDAILTDLLESQEDTEERPIPQAVTPSESLSPTEVLVRRLDAVSSVANKILEKTRKLNSLF